MRSTRLSSAAGTWTCGGCPDASASPTPCSRSCAAATSFSCSAPATSRVRRTSSLPCCARASPSRRSTDMSVAALHQRLLRVLGDRVLASEPLARHTSYRIGGPADLLARPDTVEELGSVLREANAAGVGVTLLGGGSNVLVGDGGMRGVVVKLGRGFRRVEWKA